MKSFLSYFGGKSLLADKIVPMFPPHKCYCEVFAGGAWLFFKKEESEVEIINDINRELVTLYRVVKLHIDEFIRYFRWAIVARDEFERLKIESPESLTDIQRAARFYYLLKNSFSSIIPSPSFSIKTTRKANFNILRIEEELSAAHLRLARVYIENLPYAKVIERFDREHTFFYIDPPYYNHEADYGKGIFSKEDFSKLAAILKGVKGKFLMSMNDTPEIRNIYKDFRLKKVTTTYFGKKNNRKVTELLIMNYGGRSRKEASL